VYNLYKAFKTEVERKNPVSSFSHLALNGNDIMNLTGLKPGREVGKMLTFILDKVVENPELNNKESLEKLVLEELNHCRKTNAVRLEF
jgi:tRNA nucleotidyltransferase (CCA-adding enzyme)